MASDATNRTWLQEPIDEARDHIRGDRTDPQSVDVVLYGDYLCPFCRRLRPVFRQLREALGDRLVYVFRHFPNERAHPGATFLSRATEAAAQQGRFWDLHDWLFDNPPPTEKDVIDRIRFLGLDMDRFERDLQDEEIRRRVEDDQAEGEGQDPDAADREVVGEREEGQDR